MHIVGVWVPVPASPSRADDSRLRCWILGTLAALAVLVAAPAVDAVCVGDCGDDGEVTIDEIIKGVGVALGFLPLQQCSALDASGDGDVTIDELIHAVNNALNGCAEEATGTPTASNVTRTATPTVPTSTAAPTASSSPAPTFSATPQGTPLEGVTIASRTTGMIQSTTNVLRVVPDILAVLLGHLPTQGGAGGADIEFPFECSAGGGGMLSCDKHLLPRPGPPVYTIAFNDCMILSSGGAIVTVEGAVGATGGAADICATIPSMVTLTIDNLTIQVETDRGTAQAAFSGVTAQTTLSCASGSCSCTYDTVGLDITGTVNVTSKDALGSTLRSTTATFGSGTSLVTTVQAYDTECVPQLYRLGVDGSVDLITDGAAYAVAFEDYLLRVDATSGEDLIDISGKLASACLGGRVSLQTRTLLRLDRGAVCPAEGAITVGHDSLTDLVGYFDPGVEIDLGDDSNVDDTFVSCVDQRLSVCPGD